MIQSLVSKSETNQTLTESQAAEELTKCRAENAALHNLLMERDKEIATFKHVHVSHSASSEAGTEAEGSSGAAADSAVPVSVAVHKLRAENDALKAKVHALTTDVSYLQDDLKHAEMRIKRRDDRLKDANIPPLRSALSLVFLSFG